MNKIKLKIRKPKIACMSFIIPMLICLFLQLTLKAQNSRIIDQPKGCGNYIIDNAALMQALSYESSNSNRSSASLFTIRVYFHICRNDNGTNAGATLAQLKSEFNEMIGDFAPDNICFISMGQNMIDNTTVNTNPTAALLNPYLIPGCLNIFYHALIPGYGGNAWSIPNTFCSVARGNIGAGHTTSHEVGHCLGLLHTFEPAFGFEKINGSNATTAGDQITDTPADPYAYIGQGCFNYSGCNYNGNCTDPNGATNFSPPYNNTMAYWPIALGSACTNPVFTAGQFTRVNSFLNTNSGLIGCKTPWQNLSIGNGTTYPLGYTWDVAVDYVITSGNVIINGAI